MSQRKYRRTPKDDPGLEMAILAVGSVSELARRLGISHSSIEQWERVPAERVPQVHRASGVPKHLIRPDLHDAPPEACDAA